MKRLSLCILFFLSLTAGIAAAQLPVIMSADEVPVYLEKMIAWHRQAVSLEVSPSIPREVLLKDSLQQHASKVLSSSFEFAHAVAGIIETAPKPAATDNTAQPAPKGKGILKAIAAVQKQIDDLQAGLDGAKTQKLRAQFTGKLKLAQEHLVLLQTIAENLDTADEDSNNLDHKITKIEKTIPELNGQQQKPSAAPPADQETSSGSGIYGLLTEIYNSAQAESKISALLKYTRAIRADSRKYSLAIRDGIKGIISEGDAIGQTQPPAVAGKAAAPAVTYDDLANDMKKLTKIAVGASGVGSSLDACSQDLSDWHDLISQHVTELSWRALYRFGTLLLTVAVVLIISTLVGRAMPRYVPDERRLHQLHTIQKAVVYVAIGLIVFLGFFTDLSSLGTFIGLITAGLAVALQNVILSMIAYFQFFGAFGLKIGDRITISGVTGKVMKITLLRFYLMEVRESDLGYLPTGRTVGFSNAILFQPMPFFRQTPGTNFVWSEMMLTLDPTVDHQAAYKKIHAAVDRVYGKHMNIMQQQQQHLQKLTQFKTEVSVPQIYLKITGSGLVVVIRYAVERDQESALHLQMTEELLSLIKKDPTLKVVNLG